VVDQIIADVTDEETGSARIDVVVGAHRHQDHVSGLTHSGWAHVEVGEVWLPWTEDPEDGLERLLGADDRALGLALNSLTNEKAMRTLPAGFAGRHAGASCPF
jgi:glyoxylase-like metal-dependent hydrolase (beta-lactamase superfamily II)